MRLFTFLATFSDLSMIYRSTWCKIITHISLADSGVDESIALNALIAQHQIDVAVVRNVQQIERLLRHELPLSQLKRFNQCSSNDANIATVKRILSSIRKVYMSCQMSLNVFLAKSTTSRTREKICARLLAFPMPSADACSTLHRSGLFTVSWFVIPSHGIFASPRDNRESWTECLGYGKTIDSLTVSRLLTVLTTNLNTRKSVRISLILNWLFVKMQKGLW